MTNPAPTPPQNQNPIINIYAGGDSSYALSAAGDFWAWGDVTLNYDLSLESVLLAWSFVRLSCHTTIDFKYMLGQIAEQRDEVKVWFQSSLLYQAQFNIDYFEAEYISGALETKTRELDQNTKIKDLLDTINKKSIDIIHLQAEAYGQAAQEVQDDNKQPGKEDLLLKQIQQQIISVGSEMTNRAIQIQKAQDDMEQIIRDLQNIKDQLSEISEKENQLISDRDTIENNIRKATRSQRTSQEELSNLLKDQKRIRELLSANDNIKNTLIKRQNESDGFKNTILEAQKVTSDQLQALKQRHELFKKMADERIKTIKMAYLMENKSDLEKFMVKIFYFYKSLQDTNISEIAKKSNQVIGLEEMINQSNSKLKYIKQELGNFKVNPNDGSYDILTKILEILNDNLSTRLRLNDYIQGLLLQVSQLNEEQVSHFKTQYEKKEKQAKHAPKNTKYSEKILNQKQKLIDMARDVTSYKAYTKALLAFNDSEQKEKKRGCLG